MRPFAWRRILVGLAGFCVLVLAALCGAVLLVGLGLAEPTPAVIGQPPAELAGAESVLIDGPGTTVHGWWLPGRVPGGGAVLLMHGVRGNRLGMVSRAAILHRHGFGVLLIDLQAHGETPGRHITFGARESLDAAASVAFIRARAPGERIGVIGTSLGGAAAVLGPRPLAVEALVLEAVYPDIDAALGNRLRVALGRAGPAVAPVLTTLFEYLLPPILGVSSGELRPIDRIGRINAPVLVISGMLDSYTPLAEARALFERAREPKQFWAVPGAGHVDLERFDQPAYWGVVLPFLRLNLQQL